jgi:type II secretion system protein N
MRARWEKWKKPAGYALLALFAFVFFLFVTFPYETLRQLLVLDAQEAGFRVRVGSLGPGFFGVTADDVRLSKGDEDAALRVDTLTMRPSLWPLGASVHAKLLQGKAQGVAGGLSDLSLHVSFSDLDLSKGNLKALSGLDLEGKISGEVSLNIPSTPSSPSGKQQSLNLSQASGNLSLNADGLLLKGGTVTVPLYGQMTPLDLPRVKLGTLEGAVKLDKGTGNVERLQTRNGDLETNVTGTLKLGKDLAYSEANLQVRLKAEPALMKNGFIGMGISALPTDPSNPSFHAARVSGFLGSPSFVPGI